MSSDHRRRRAIIDGILAGRIRRDPRTFEYVDERGRLHNIDPDIYEMEARRWLRLYTDGRIEVTDAGRARASKPAPADPFQVPGVAA